jgi:hypothetical protein
LNAQFHWCTTIGARWLLRVIAFLRRRAAVRMQKCIVQSSPRHQVRTKGSSALAHHVKLCVAKESIDVHTKASAVAREPSNRLPCGVRCMQRSRRFLSIWCRSNGAHSSAFDSKSYKPHTRHCCTCTCCCAFSLPFLVLRSGGAGPARAPRVGGLHHNTSESHA